jgi:hypothetical protein
MTNRSEHEGIVERLLARGRGMALAFGVALCAAPHLVGCATDMDDGLADDGVDALEDDGQQVVAQSEQELARLPSCVTRSVLMRRLSTFSLASGTTRTQFLTTVRVTNRCAKAVGVKVDFAWVRDSACTLLGPGRVATFEKTASGSFIRVNGLKRC